MSRMRLTAFQTDPALRAAGGIAGSLRRTRRSGAPVSRREVLAVPAPVASDAFRSGIGNA